MVYLRGLSIVCVSLSPGFVADLGIVLIRCKKCGALYHTGISTDRKTYDTQVRSMNLQRICPYCRTKNSSAVAQLVFQGQ